MDLSEIEIVKVEPPLGSNNHVFMQEQFFTNVWLRTTFPVQLLRPQLWTNVTHKLNPEGKWHGIDFKFLKKDLETGELHYQVAFIVTSTGTFDYTFRVGIIKLANGMPSYNPSLSTSMSNLSLNRRSSGDIRGSNDNLPSVSVSSPTPQHNSGSLHHRTHSHDYEGEEDIVDWKWAGGYGQNGVITVTPPNESMPWTKGPQYVEIAPHVFIGNFIAASQAAELDFTAVLNLAAELDLPPDPKVKHKKISIGDGAHHAIDDEMVMDAITWIKERLREGGNVLLMCRAGIGRSGSLGIAYLYYLHPELSYKEVLDNIWSVKADIYPHKGLQQSLERLFPRQKNLTPHPKITKGFSSSNLKNSPQLLTAKQQQFRPPSPQPKSNGSNGPSQHQ